MYFSSPQFGGWPPFMGGAASAGFSRGFGFPPSMGNFFGHWMMGQSCGWMGQGGGWWRPQHHHHAGGCRGDRPHEAQVPREGRWDSAKGGFVVGTSGRLEATIRQSDADFNNKIQYRTGRGDWQDLGWSKDTGETATIHARPGSTVQFRIQTPQGNNFQAGTAANSDGQDHGKISANADGGVRIGFEDYAHDKSFDDTILDIKDVRRRW